MALSQKHVFWQALIAALIVFNFGIFLGYMLENSRVGKVNSLYAESEIGLLDVKILSDLYSSQITDCSESIKGNVDFANKVYEDAQTLQAYEDASRISDSIKIQHKKYDLLRTLFWINSIKIKERCNASFHNVVYFYQYNNPGVEQDAIQEVFSRMLGDIKTKYDGKVMLIPIAADNDISSIDILLETYKIDKLPTILIDEKIKITEANKEEIEKYLN